MRRVRSETDSITCITRPQSEKRAEPRGFLPELSHESPKWRVYGEETRRVTNGEKRTCETCVRLVCETCV